MRVIVPGGFYSHDSAQKKIWLDYSYYGLGVENVESIKNITRNSIIYSVKRSIPGISFQNGCITYSRDCYSEDSDKLQIVLMSPIPSPVIDGYFHAGYFGVGYLGSGYFAGVIA